MATPQTINIALIDTDTPVPSVLSTRGLYSTIFQQLLEAALARLSKTTLFATQPLPKVQWATYNVVQGDYPPDIAPFDAFVISGSAASAYDTDPWITTLEAWIRTAFTTRPHAKFFGSCFGHQILCSALLSSPAVPPADVVTKNAAGWELGVLPIALSPAFLRAFPVDVRALPSAKRGDVLRLQMVHADHVVMPPEAGARWCVMGGTPRCAVQGVYEAAQGRVFTLQGHFEFDRFVNGETIKVFGKGWGEESIREVLKDVDADDDAEWAAEVVMAFLLGLGKDGGRGLMRVPIGEGGAVMEGGMMTPPEEV